MDFVEFHLVWEVLLEAENKGLEYFGVLVVYHKVFTEKVTVRYTTTFLSSLSLEKEMGLGQFRDIVIIENFLHQFTIYFVYQD